LHAYWVVLLQQREANGADIQTVIRQTMPTVVFRLAPIAVVSGLRIHCFKLNQRIDLRVAITSQYCNFVVLNGANVGSEWKGI